MTVACFVIKTLDAKFLCRAAGRFSVLGREGETSNADVVVFVFFQFASHKKYRAVLKKEKRKKRRQELARIRDSGSKLFVLFSGCGIAPIPAPQT